MTAIPISSVKETIYLLTLKEIRERIKEARNTPIDESEDFSW